TKVKANACKKRLSSRKAVFAWHTAGTLLTAGAHLCYRFHPGSNKVGMQCLRMKFLVEKSNSTGSQKVAFGGWRRPDSEMQFEGNAYSTLKRRSI
ncbi:hypothetical protein, partial [Asticcacaulis sp. AC466]|uniref:hypothetical protein n=1 Tax=Asticcacaulis sp. AC466 TaxID=1282362 RepID=UPI001F1D97FA